MLINLEFVNPGQLVGRNVLLDDIRIITAFPGDTDFNLGLVVVYRQSTRHHLLRMVDTGRHNGAFNPITVCVHDFNFKSGQRDISVFAILFLQSRA